MDKVGYNKMEDKIMVKLTSYISGFYRWKGRDEKFVE